MIDALLHLCGLCHDSHTHVNLLQLVAGGACASWGCFCCYVRTKLKG